MPRRSKLTPEQRAELTAICTQPSPKEFGGKSCPYCGVEMIVWDFRNTCMTIPPTAATRDHIIPKSKGGRMIPGNRIIVCWRCNVDKRNRTLDVWIGILRHNGDPRATLVEAVKISLDARRPILPMMAKPNRSESHDASNAATDGDNTDRPQQQNGRFGIRQDGKDIVHE